MTELHINTRDCKPLDEKTAVALTHLFGTIYTLEANRQPTVEFMCGPTCGCGKTYTVPNDGQLHLHPCSHCSKEKP